MKNNYTNNSSQNSNFAHGPGDRDRCWMGAKIKTQKNILGFKQNTKNSLDQNLTPQKSHAEFPSQKNFERNYAAGIHGNYHIITPKNPYLNQKKKKNTCQNFPTPKILKPKISNPKKSFDHLCHLKSRVPPLGGVIRKSYRSSEYLYP